jgi:ADP-heptose:LPS heptosyltransferase
MSDLLYHTGALGDFVTTIPAIRFYRKRNAGRKITLLGRPAIGKFAHDIRLIDEWLDVDSPEYLPLFYDHFSLEARNLLAPYATAILFTDADSPLVKNIARRGNTRLFQQQPFASAAMHIVDYHLSLFGDPAAIDLPDKIPRIVLSPEALKISARYLPPDLHKPVAIHPGSGSLKKNWPFENFLSVADGFRSKKIPVLWIKGPAEESLQYPAGDKVVSNQPFSTLAALFSQCAAYIGNDSGITHLSAAVGCPTVAIFGPSDPGVWGPRGSKVSIFHKDLDFKAITIDEVIEKIRTLMRA